MELEKVTRKSGARGGKRYHDACGAAHGLDLLGERWAMLVVRELCFGPRRFGDLKGDLCGISANVLTQRLEGLEAAGVLHRRKLPPPASVQVYELTDWGYEAAPIFQVLGRWAARSPSHDPTLPLSAVSAMMSMQTMIDMERAGGFTARMGFVLAGQSFVAWIAGGVLNVRRVDAPEGEAIIEGRPEALAGWLYGKPPLAAMEASGDLTVRGDRALAETWQTFFDLPPKAA